MGIPYIDLSDYIRGYHYTGPFGILQVISRTVHGVSLKFLQLSMTYPLHLTNDNQICLKVTIKYLQHIRQLCLSYHTSLPHVFQLCIQLLSNNLKRFTIQAAAPTRMFRM